MSYIQDANDDPMLEQLIQATQQLNRQINDAIQDDAINWGNVPAIQDLSESECVSNCRMRLPRLCSTDAVLDCCYVELRRPKVALHRWHSHPSRCSFM